MKKQFETLSNDDLAAVNGAGLLTDTLGAITAIVPGLLSSVSSEIGSVAKSIESTLGAVPIVGGLLGGVVATLV